MFSASRIPIPVQPEKWLFSNWIQWPNSSRIRWPLCSGFGGRFQIGFGGRFAPEYAGGDEKEGRGERLATEITEVTEVRGDEDRGFKENIQYST